MLERSNFSCEACGAARQGQRDFHIDHCHKTGKVRGILCSKCNTALGLLDDSIDKIEQLKSYLGRFV